MLMTDAPVADAELPESAARMIGRFYFGTTSGAAFVSALVMLALLPESPMSSRVLLVGSLLGFALLCLLAVRASAADHFPMNTVLCAMAIGAMGLTLLVSVELGEGLRSTPLAFCGLIICVVGAITSMRVSLVLGGIAAMQMAGLAWAETSGLLPTAPAATPLSMALTFHLLIIVCSAIGGHLISRVLDHYLRAAAQREQRFRGLLRVAADWYWEQDRDFRFTTMLAVTPSGEAPSRGDQLDHAPWQLTDADLSEDQLDAHHADLEAHRPFSGLLARRRDARGQWRTVSVSGEPKFDSGGIFRGYWGVARDVTDEVRAQHATTASETRYRELFSRSPSPLFLHRRGFIFDANEAAARLFGFANAAAMNGCVFADLFGTGAMRERVVERTAELERLPVGEGLSVEDFQLRSVDGRLLSIQATAVRIDTASGPANLSIIFDITMRTAVANALRRSEAMLSHLFATSPDCIALTEMATGRYAMVNPAFCRLTGFSADEVVGRTAAELGLWHDQRNADRLLTLLERNGTVTDLPAVFVAKSGALVSMLLAAGRFVMDERDYLVVNARDVTESERTRLQHTAILERASIGIAFTRDQRFLQANPYFERMFGWEPGALLGRPGTVVWPGEEAYLAMGMQAGPLLAAGQPFETESQMRRHDGSLFWCRLLGQVVDRNEPTRGGTIWIAEDVTERRRLDQALGAARDAAEAASLAKSAFLANTSHEIRTPLNGLLGLARLAMRHDLDAPRRRQYLEQLLDSAQSLAGIMSDILDVSKIEAGKITIDDTPFDLHDLLHAVHHAYQSLAQVKGLALLLTIDANVPVTVRSDPVRVRQILSNFITNALKFTDRGQVRIEASLLANGAVRLAVADTGPGVPRELHERLFTPFSQGDSSTTRRFGGTGLGLSICRELAHLMGGRVGLDSTRVDGSTFWAELPLRTSAPATAADPAPNGPDVLAGAHVLMAEDNPVNMMIAVAMLEQWGLRVAQAADGRAAVAAVHAAARTGDPFDAVLMDVQMPIMSGHEAARELRRHYPPAVLPILALTAAALVSERDEAYAAGMDDFLTKPIDAPKLRAALVQHLRRRPAAA